ncbi:hypothetical protein [Bradyrhizobium tunisiense]|jgi:hypothetical protein|uniref:hypothetical protein n=1 Tax=Bradyrhizobium tunisiense TaxID=3278709 RepID=UPI0035D6A231
MGRFAVSQANAGSGPRVYLDVHPIGGLCGWGVIVDTSNEKAVTVEIGGWMDRPVPRDDIYSKNAIRPENMLRRNPQGTNFPLTRELTTQCRG